MALKAFAIGIIVVLMPQPFINRPVNEWNASINNFLLYELLKGLQAPVNNAENLTSILEFICVKNDVDILQLL